MTRSTNLACHVYIKIAMSDCHIVRVGSYSFKSSNENACISALEYFKINIVLSGRYEY